jgi:SAM-dependent methyltransferase/uncharacterized protein YbaR (Trm112 family)
MPGGLFPDGSRVSPGRGLGPVPRWGAGTALTELLDRLAPAPASSERGRKVEVESGLLICGGCGRWFPIERGIPELLPDHLRDLDREGLLFARIMRDAPAELRKALARLRPLSVAESDPGAHYKKAEIGIRSLIHDETFFGPGLTSPFNPWNSDFTTYLISLFGTAVPMLGLERGGVVVDSGCGYAWTTEWLFRSGYEAIGIDICRTYLEIGVNRMGSFRPHLVVGDVENLPLLSGIADAVLAYESFHHVPDRRRATAGYHRVLNDSGTVILAEPGAAHELAAESVEAMEKYGILEKGMELADVAAYAEGTSFQPPQQIVVLRAFASELGDRLDPGFVDRHSIVRGNLFQLTKRKPAPPPPPPEPPPTRVERGLKLVRSALRLCFA